MTKHFPDIEIYIRHVSNEALICWLESRFDVKGKFPFLTLSLEKKITDCLIVSDAVEGGYTSVWFKSNGTPWKTDRDCARDAYRYLKKEVRCNASVTSNDSFQWLQLDKKGEIPVSW